MEKEKPTRPFTDEFNYIMLSYEKNNDQRKLMMRHTKRLEKAKIPFMLKAGNDGLTYLVVKNCDVVAADKAMF